MPLYPLKKISTGKHNECRPKPFYHCNPLLGTKHLALDLDKLAVALCRATKAIRILCIGRNAHATFCERKAPQQVEQRTTHHFPHHSFIRLFRTSDGRTSTSEKTTPPSPRKRCPPPPPSKFPAPLPSVSKGTRGRYSNNLSKQQMSTPPPPLQEMQAAHCPFSTAGHVFLSPRAPVAPSFSWPPSRPSQLVSLVLSRASPVLSLACDPTALGPAGASRQPPARDEKNVPQRHHHSRQREWPRWKRYSGGSRTRRWSARPRL